MAAPPSGSTLPHSRLLSPPTPGFPVETSVICRAAGRMDKGQHHLSPACPADASLWGSRPGACRWQERLTTTPAWSRNPSAS